MYLLLPYLCLPKTTTGPPTDRSSREAAAAVVRSSSQFSHASLVRKPALPPALFLSIQTLPPPPAPTIRPGSHGLPRKGRRGEGRHSIAALWQRRTAVVPDIQCSIGG